ncbi:MAG: peptidylprolyl isomerase [Planctomycetota bacterium]
MTRLVAVILAVSALLARPLSAQERPASMVVAEVNGVVITYSELVKGLGPAIQELRANYVGDELEKRISLLLFKRLAYRKNEILLRQEAERLVTKQISDQIDERVRRRLRDDIAGAGSMTALRETLAREGKTLDDQREQYRTEILIGALLNEHVYSRVAVSPEELLRYYEVNGAEFRRPRAAKMIHILITPERQGGKEQALAFARELRREIEGGADMRELARMHSSCPHAQDGGVWENVTPGTFRKEVDDRIFALSASELSDVIESSIGCHLVKVLETTPEGIIPFEEAQKGIYEKLFEKKFNERRDRYLSELEKRAHVRLLWTGE